MSLHDNNDYNDLQYVIICSTHMDGVGPFIYHHEAQAYIDDMLGDCGGTHTIEPFRPPRRK
jgi:hypothetical protein